MATVLADWRLRYWLFEEQTSDDSGIALLLWKYDWGWTWLKYYIDRRRSVSLCRYRRWWFIHACFHRTNSNSSAFFDFSIHSHDGTGTRIYNYWCHIRACYTQHFLVRSISKLSSACLCFPNHQFPVARQAICVCVPLPLRKILRNLKIEFLPSISRKRCSWWLPPTKKIFHRFHFSFDTPLKNLLQWSFRPVPSFCLQLRRLQPPLCHRRSRMDSALGKQRVWANNRWALCFLQLLLKLKLQLLLKVKLTSKFSVSCFQQHTLFVWETYFFRCLVSSSESLK